MPTEFERALNDLINARNDAALPLTFAADATAEQNDRSDGQLRANLPQISGGWDAVKEAVVNIATLFGEIARTIARVQDPNATVITKEQAGLARKLAERACRLSVAGQARKSADEVGVAEGIVCGG